jgi:26S proteasome regulatory subunit T4
MTTEGEEVPMTPVANPVEEARTKALESYKKKLLEHREVEAKVRGLRLGLRDSNKEYDKTEDDLKALQSVGQIIGELLRQLDEERFVCHVPVVV